MTKSLRIIPLSTENKKTDAEKARSLLEEAWAYYVPEQVLPEFDLTPDQFEFANAA